jgi:hypothetical protein
VSECATFDTLNRSGLAMLADDNPAATEGPADEDRGEGHAEGDRITDDLIAGFGK